MNFIAHAYYSKSFDRFMLGQLLGDFATKQALVGSDTELQRGVAAHRELDVFTDAHEAFNAGIQVLEPSCKRYAPVVMDIVLDYFLVKKWSALSENGDFDTFLGDLYPCIERLAHELPERMKGPAMRMVERDWFSPFSSIEGLNIVLYYTSRRVRRPEWILASRSCIRDNEAVLEDISLRLLQDSELRKFDSERFRIAVCL